MNQKKSLPLVEHLEELRKRIIISGVGFLVFFLLSFLFVKDIYQYLIKDIDQQLTILSPGDVIWVNMAISAISALALTIPLLSYQLWGFMAPAMTEDEKKATLAFIPGLFFLFIIGLCFSFFIIFPMVMSFLTGLAESQFQTMYTVTGYFTFLFRLTVPIAVVFELPAVVMFLTRLGLLNPQQLRKSRKYAYFILIVLSVVLSPPDFLSDVLIMLPMLLLYEISILLSAWVKRKQTKLSLTQS
ncbi:twin-arginine translocase subunit TatC [Paenibacillus alkaliterrae]|uniref:twin-arginine translocase subunit TatC n=1 Tax=Paenibacillus alkaliterrae TaxID=320909 RepID=UPI0038B23E88